MASLTARAHGRPVMVDDDEGFGFVITNMDGSHGASAAGPQAYYVKVPVGANIRPHFHTVDQFQVVTAGLGTLGRHTVSPGFVHYTDAYTPYGPIRALDAAFEYLTLRPAADRGINFMPESRDKRDGRGGRQVTGVGGPEVIAPQRDGLHVHTLAVGKRHPVHLQPGPASIGAHVLVVHGALESDGRSYEEGSTMFLATGERVASLVAGSGGVELLVLHYPGHDS